MSDIKFDGSGRGFGAGDGQVFECTVADGRDAFLENGYITVEYYVFYLVWNWLRVLNGYVYWSVWSRCFGCGVLKA